MYFVLRLELAFSVVLAALASATAPASTMMTIRQTGAKGDFVDTLLQVVALDDVVGLVLYSVAISVALASSQGDRQPGHPDALSASRAEPADHGAWRRIWTCNEAAHAAQTL